jgi:DNA-binding NarL/FixJ family response regulator
VLSEQPDCQVVAEAAAARRLCAGAKAAPDVAIIDITAPLNGLEVTRQTGCAARHRSDHFSPCTKQQPLIHDLLQAAPWVC